MRFLVFILVVSLSFIPITDVVGQMCRLDSVVMKIKDKSVYRLEYKYYDDSLTTHAFELNENPARWIADSKSTIIADQFKKIKKETRFTYVESFDTWYFQYNKPEMYTYVHDTLGRVVQRDADQWNNDSLAWVKHQRKEYTYTNSPQKIVRKWYSWNGSEYGYILSVAKSSFNAQNLLEIDSMFAGGFDGSEIYSGRNMYSYNSLGDLILKEEWDQDKPSRKEVNLYDTINNNWIEKSMYYWVDSAWSASAKKTYYLGSELTNEVQSPSSYHDHSNYFEHDISEALFPKFKVDSVIYSGFDDSTQTWVKGYVYNYYYNDCRVLSDREVEIEQSLSLYPNPNSGLFTIRAQFPINTITVCNQSGRVVKTITLSNAQKSIEVQLEKSGVYFMHVQSGNTSQVLKAVVLK